jgi:hypothetical protein
MLRPRTSNVRPAPTLFVRGIVAGNFPGAAVLLGPSVTCCGRAFFLASSQMSRVPWPEVLHRQSRAHLVVGVVAQAEGPVGGDELTAVRNLLNRLVRQQELHGGYAATIVRDTGRPEVHFAFVEEADARKFGDAVRAETTDTYPGWASQRAFDLPSEKLASLEASLPAPRYSPRQRIADGPRLMRRGPRQSPVERYDDEE